MIRLLRPRTAAAILAIVLAVCVLLSTVANAAGLSLSGISGGVFAQTNARCTDATLAVSPSGTESSGQYSEVTISGDFGSCTGGNVSVYEATGSHTVLFSAAGTVSGSTMVATSTTPFTPPATADGNVVVGLDGWLIPATWSYTPPDPEPEPQGPVYPGNPETGLIDINWTLVTNNPVQACFVATVTTTSTTPVTWRLTIDTSLPPFNGATNPGGYNLEGPDSWRYQKFPNTPSTGFLQIGGTSGGGRLTVVAGQEYTVNMCNWGLPPGVQTPSAYSVAVTDGPWTSTLACRTLTVTGNGSSRFYFAWQALLDMSAARAQVANFTHWSNPTNNGSQLTMTQPVANQFQLTSNTAANLVNTQQYVFTYCANGW